MRRFGKLAVCLAGGLVLVTSARAGDLALAGNPYEPIIARNVFGLNPITNSPPTTDVEGQLPKITPTGTMSILGQLQVLYKVAPKPGQKDAKEQFYVLSEGQAQDNIEVIHIDEPRALITFNNNGTVQELPLANAPKNTGPAFTGGGGSSGGGSSSGLIPARSPGSRGVGSGPGARVGGFNRTQAGAGGAGGNPALNNNANNANNATRGSRSAAGQNNSMSDMTAEEQMVLMAAQHLKAQEEGNPAAAIFPPTPYDDEAGIKPPPMPGVPTTTTTTTTTGSSKRRK
jgi:hypothetical protein